MSSDFCFNMVTLAVVLRLKWTWTIIVQELMGAWIRMVALELVRRTWSQIEFEGIAGRLCQNVRKRSY